MKVRVLQTTGQGHFTEVEWDKPEPASNEIEVKAVMTGVCRSDIDMMNGTFGPLPLEMQGHEGLGIVTKVGKDVYGVWEGDFVATRGEPAYADYYNCRDHDFVVVPELAPRYILEPVACGINCVERGVEYFNKNYKTLIIGSGFLSYVAFKHLQQRYDFLDEVDILGASNINFWGDQLLLATSVSYDNVIDLSGKYKLGTDIGLNNNAVIIDAVGKTINKEEAEVQLWKSVTIVRPSPRSPNFYGCMLDACDMIRSGELDIDYFWTKGYNRNTEWQQAFEDANNRPANYSRGYLKWD